MTSTEVSRPSLVGSRVARTVDARLLRGNGRFVADITRPGMLHAHILRSPLAAAEVARIDAAAAVGAGAFVLHALDDHGLDALPCVWLQPDQRQVDYPVLEAHVRYVGQPVGIVVAGSRAVAEDLAELVDVAFDPTTAIVRDAQHALSPDAPLVRPELGTNVCVELVRGDPWSEVSELIEGAAHVVRRRLRIQRVAGHPLETRGVVAEWDPQFERLTVWMSSQAVHHAREHLSVSLGLRPDQIHVIAPDVGGAFGTKEHVYPDEVLVCAAALRTGRPVKWVEDRYEHFTATLHARDQTHDAVLALDADGRFLALWSDFVHDLGAHPSNVGSGPAQVASNMLQGPYRIDRAGTRARCVLTNRTPTGAYRGFGMQQAAWVRERLVDEAARELGIDPVELRERNMLRSDELPFTTRFLQNYDSGDYVAVLRQAQEQVESSTLADDDGRRRGVGFANHVEFTGLGPSSIQQLVGFQLNGFETSVVRLELDGSVTAVTGGAMIGQGLETSLAQLAADQLGVALERVRIVAGDSDLIPYSSAGSIASRSMVVAGGALMRSSGQLRTKIAEIAAHRLEADAQDIVLADGAAHVRGTPARALAFDDIARAAWLGWDLPAGVDPGLEESATYDPPDITYSYATHAAQVAVDVETGVVEIERYVVAHDCGVVVNPMIADGQIQGGVAQGLGIATLEEVTYDDDGQPSVSTYLDYLLPLSNDVPTVEIRHLETPSPHTPGGMKGLGEGGMIPAPAAVGNAVAAALPEIAGKLLQTPITPSLIVELLAAASVDGGQDAVAP